jgi:hypothetical protein
MKSFIPVCTLLFACMAFQTFADTNLPFLSRDEQMLLQDAATFFEHSTGFADRGKLADFLDAAFPEGVPEKEILRKINGLTERVQLTPRMHVEIGLRPDRLCVAYHRFFPGSSDGNQARMYTLSLCFEFDKNHGLLIRPQVLYSADIVLVSEDMIEPNELNQPPRMPVSGTPAAGAPVSPTSRGAGR